MVALLAALPLWGPGMVNTRGGGDSPFLLQRTYEMVANLRAGVFPVRWMSDAAYGLGYPFFSYYAALPYYLAGGLVVLGMDILTALKTVQTLGFLAAALAMYGWMHCLTGNRWAAWLAAVAYTFAPFHLVNVYVRGDSLSEFWAFVWYPLVLWGIERISESAKQPNSETTAQSASMQVCRCAGVQVAAAGLAYGGLILTHNISAFIFTPFALLYLWMRWLSKKGAAHRSLLMAHCPLFIGLLLSAWFWLPALAELKYVQLGPSVGISPDDYFHYSQHFRTLNLVQDTLFFDYSVAPNLGGRSPFAMGLVQAVCAVIGLGTWITKGSRKGDDREGGDRKGGDREEGDRKGGDRKGRPYGWFLVCGLLISTVMI
ncbi:MAG: hypothetical protein N2508_00520, partial [Anaerolineae bacterium]|nr:hypothetical protein [Anaerolineae bacterium]